MEALLVTLRFNCGCGFQASALSTAEKHTLATGHTIHVLGQVSVVRKPKPQWEPVAADGWIAEAP